MIEGISAFSASLFHDSVQRWTCEYLQGDGDIRHTPRVWGPTYGPWIPTSRPGVFTSGPNQTWSTYSGKKHLLSFKPRCSFDSLRQFWCHIDFFFAKWVSNLKTFDCRNMCLLLTVTNQVRFFQYNYTAWFLHWLFLRLQWVTFISWYIR